MSDDVTSRMDNPFVPTLEQMQRWTQTIGRGQQLLMEHAARTMEIGRAHV